MDYVEVKAHFAALMRENPIVLFLDGVEQLVDEGAGEVQEGGLITGAAVTDLHPERSSTTSKGGPSAVVAGVVVVKGSKKFVHLSFLKDLADLHKNSRIIVSTRPDIKDEGNMRCRHVYRRRSLASFEGW